MDDDEEVDWFHVNFLFYIRSELYRKITVISHKKGEGENDIKGGEERGALNVMKESGKWYKVEKESLNDMKV